MKRIEIHLNEKDVEILDSIAKKNNRSRKNYCETVLRGEIEKEGRAHGMAMGEDLTGRWRPLNS
jgi:hypothetical protein